MIDILIPTCREYESVRDMIHEIQATIALTAFIFPSCSPSSAAVNRNKCLDHATSSKFAIMLDDDISGFYPGWDLDLLAPFRDPLVCMVSARLMNPDGSIGPTCSRCYEMEPEEIEVKSNGHCVLPSAAIAFRNIGLRFDERFKGSGWEDNDFAFQMLKANPAYRFIQSNRCRLTHMNNQTKQAEYWTHNKELFAHKWLKEKAAT